MKIGYARVSTLDQNPDAQKDALSAAGCDRIYVDKASGKLAHRPELDKALDALRDDDCFVITKLDRLGRSMRNLVDLCETIQNRGGCLQVIDQGIDTSTPAGKLFFHVIAAIAEFEHALTIERTKEGLAAARARGRTGGRRAALTPRQVQLARDMYNEVGLDGKRVHTVQQIADELQVSRPTIYRHLETAANT